MFDPEEAHLAVADLHMDEADSVNLDSDSADSVRSHDFDRVMCSDSVAAPCNQWSVFEPLVTDLVETLDIPLSSFAAVAYHYADTLDLPEPALVDNFDFDS